MLPADDARLDGASLVFLLRRLKTGPWLKTPELLALLRAC